MRGGLLAVLLGMLACLAACRETPAPPAPVGLLEAPEERRAAARRACLEAGGDWRGPTPATERCFRTPEDANEPCRTGAECEGVCLARSMTCAPVIPLLGCNDVIAANGLRSELCVQ